MDHVAIIRQPFFDKIVSEEKTIESRWYRFRKTPFENIKHGEKVYVKEPGKPVSLVFDVSKALFFYDLDEEKIKKIIKEYGKDVGISLSYLDQVKDKKFCTLIFAENVRKINPFNINKKGYGNMCAWITLKNIAEIKIR